MADIHRIVSEKNSSDVLESTAVRTRSLLALYPESKAPASIFDPADDSESIFGEEPSILGAETFDFDNDIVNSKVYRKTLISAREYRQNMEKSQQNQNARYVEPGRPYTVDSDR